MSDQLGEIKFQRDACIRALQGLVGDDNEDPTAIMATAVMFLVAQLPSRLWLTDMVNQLGALIRAGQVSGGGPVAPYMPGETAVNTPPSSVSEQTLEIARLVGTSVEEGGLEHQAIIAGIRRLRAQVRDSAGGVNEPNDRPACGESDGNGGICGEHVPDGFCSEHGPVGPEPTGAHHVVDDIEPGPCRGQVGLGEWGWCYLITSLGLPVIKVKDSGLEIIPSEARLLAADLLSAAARAEQAGATT